MLDVDNHKLMYHVGRVAEWKEKGDCYPIYVEIGLTNRCNHRCVFCALDFLEYKNVDIDSNVMSIGIEDMAQSGVKSIMFAGEGEPLLHKDIGLFTQKAKQYGLDVAITTNGVPFTQKKREECLPNLSWIRFSVDSGSPDNYAKVHGTNPRDFEKVIKNIEESIVFKNANKLKTTIGVQFLTIPQNLDQAVNLAETLKNIGADNLQIKPYSHHPLSQNDLVVNIKDYNALESDLRAIESEDFKIVFRGATAERIEQGLSYPICYGLPFFALIDAKGNVLPCNLFYDNPKFTYGNIYEKSFSQIWKGDQRKKVLNRIKEKGVEDCRKGCRLDVINRYLHRLENPLPHDNFP